MIVLIALALGAISGYRAADKRGGNWQDKAQYTIVYAMLFAVVGLAMTIGIHRIAG